MSIRPEHGNAYHWFFHFYNVEATVGVPKPVISH